jgi:hypothetical protein
MAAPVQGHLKVGDCVGTAFTDLIQYPAVKCSDQHYGEVVFLGRFPDAGKPPTAGSSATKNAYEICQAPTTKFLGGDWHDGLLELSILEPDALGWTGGARWFACVISGSTSVDNALPSYYDTGSLKGALHGSGPVRLRCVDWHFSADALTDWSVAPCSSRHGGEFAGTFSLSGSTYPGDRIAQDACEVVVGHYVGFSDGINRNRAVGSVIVRNLSSDWKLGDHTMRCYAVAYTHDHKFVGSVKGIGTRPVKG